MVLTLLQCAERHYKIIIIIIISSQSLALVLTT